MSLSSARSNLTRTQSAIAGLEKDDSQLAKREADLTATLNRAREAVRKASTASTKSAKLRDFERAQVSVAKVLSDRANLAKKIAIKRKEEHRYRAALSKEEAKEQKNLAESVARMQKEQERRQSELNAQVREAMQAISGNVASFGDSSAGQIEYDVFISHATEDKASFVEGLATELESRGLKIWYDNFTLKWGDKLRQEIDRGLRSSRFGVVVLSKSFFEKDWPQEELDGLNQMEIAKRTRILPIWHNITRDELDARTPLLASRLALNTAVLSTQQIADQLEELVKSDTNRAS